MNLVTTVSDPTVPPAAAHEYRRRLRHPLQLAAAEGVRPLRRGQADLPGRRLQPARHRLRGVDRGRGRAPRPDHRRRQRQPRHDAADAAPGAHGVTVLRDDGELDRSGQLIPGPVVNVDGMTVAGFSDPARGAERPRSGAPAGAAGRRLQVRRRPPRGVVRPAAAAAADRARPPARPRPRAARHVAAADRSAPGGDPDRPRPPAAHGAGGVEPPGRRRHARRRRPVRGRRGAGRVHRPAPRRRRSAGLGRHGADRADLAATAPPGASCSISATPARSAGTRCPPRPGPRRRAVPPRRPRPETASRRTRGPRHRSRAARRDPGRPGRR